jgi:predicted amidohydrolase YtcJ
VNPWIAIETLVTRENPGGSARSFGKGEAISVKEAIQLFTVNSARHRHLEGSLGAIAPGMVADLVVLSKDPYEIPARELHEINVITTYIGGEVVFQR